jgi:ParB family chromosome partitioning protein
MSKMARRLGRGLDSLVSNLRSESRQQAETVLTANREAQNAPASVDASADRSGVHAVMLSTEALRTNPFQPRNVITTDDVVSIAASIRQHGLLQPITARVLDGQYQIIAGERRWRAAKSIGMTTVPVIIREATDEQMLELALIENLQREDLNPIDRARAYRQFCTQFGLKQEEVADRLGEARTTVTNYLRLLELADPIRAMVAAGTLTMGHARCLLGVDNETHRLRLAEAIVANELSVRAAEEVVRRGKAFQAGATDVALDGGGALLKSRGTRGGRLRSAHLRDLEQRFERAVKTKVVIHEGRRKGSGRITIEYFSLDDFDRIAGMLGVEGE